MTRHHWFRRKEGKRVLDIPPPPSKKHYKTFYKLLGIAEDLENSGRKENSEDVLGILAKELKRHLDNK